MVLGCYYLTMDPLGKQPKRIRIFSSEDEAILSYQLKEKTGLTLHEPIDAEVRDVGRRARRPPARAASDDRRPDHLQPDPARPAPLFNDKVMMRSRAQGARRRVLPAARRRDETAHLVDGIKSVGFDFATRGGMTIGLCDIEVPKDKGERLKAADDERRPDRPPVPARPDHRGRALRAGRRRLAEDDRRAVRRDDEGPQGGRAGHDDDRVRRPREQGQHRPARRDARPDGRPVGPDHRRPRPEQLPGGDDGPRVLHLDPRRPQGPRRHRPPDGRLGLPDPAPRRRRPGRHHP